MEAHKVSTTQTQDPKYEIKQGLLAETYGLFIPGTHNTGAHISADSVRYKELRDQSYHVSNVAFGTKRKGKLLLGISLTPSAFDEVFGRNTSDVCNELIDTGYVRLDSVRRDNILRLEQKGELVFVDPSTLELKSGSDDYSFFPIRIAKHEKDARGSREYWVHAGYGSGYKRQLVMDVLRTEYRNPISEIAVFPMNPDHVAEHVEDNEIVARPCWLSSFEVSFFGTDGRLGSNDIGLRGVLKPSEGDDAPVSLLEELAGKGAVAHGDVAVVRQGDVSQKAWDLLTQKQ